MPRVEPSQKSSRANNPLGCTRTAPNFPHAGGGTDCFRSSDARHASFISTIPHMSHCILPLADARGPTWCGARLFWRLQINAVHVVHGQTLNVPCEPTSEHGLCDWRALPQTLAIWRVHPKVEHPQNLLPPRALVSTCYTFVSHTRYSVSF